MRLGSHLKTVTEKTDVLRQIKNENVTISPKIRNMLRWELLFAK